MKRACSEVKKPISPCKGGPILQLKMCPKAQHSSTKRTSRSSFKVSNPSSDDHSEIASPLIIKPKSLRVLLSDINTKKKQVNKLIKEQKLRRIKERIFEQKVKEKASQKKDVKMGKLIERIKQKDGEVDGADFIERLDRINSRVDRLKMRGLRIIIHHHLRKKSTVGKGKDGMKLRRRLTLIESPL
uniref:Uncharacterized protein n=1 Tax=Euplotes crassus TaxID=5936 RepID=A0A7S3KHA7_EUPCR|mmetsp:Transcript_27458/g.27334  ORF Transcript_27458/g.27334 Transcript_27458/m.27334 type:complete len:186 (+) Transcript_27458:678-1235(+)